jgi:hypothetical protein
VYVIGGGDASGTPRVHCGVLCRDGSYEVAAADSVNRGTKIVLHLKESCKVGLGPLSPTQGCGMWYAPR